MNGNWGTSPPHEDETLQLITNVSGLGDRLAFYVTLLQIRRLPEAIKCPWEEQ